MNIQQKVFQSASFLAYWLQAMNEHSLHPPFVYQLYKKAIKKDIQPPFFQEIAQLRNEFLQSREKIAIADLGAGSSISDSKKRSIHQIARHSLTKAKFSRLLYRLIQYMEAKTVLELGTSLGINTLYLSSATPNGSIYTLEGCPQTAKVANQLFTKWPEKNIHLLEGNIDTALPNLLSSKSLQIDAAYLDANHTYQASINYFQLLLPCLHENSFVVLDDIYWSKGMKKAWKEIHQHPKVSLSLDLYSAGILFFKAGIPKAHYILEF